MLKSNAECMRDNYILAARDLLDLAMRMDSIGHDKEIATADTIMDRLRSATHAYGMRPPTGGPANELG